MEVCIAEIPAQGCYLFGLVMKHCVILPPREKETKHCVTLGKLLNASESHFIICKME